MRLRISIIALVLFLTPAFAQMPESSRSGMAGAQTDTSTQPGMGQTGTTGSAERTAYPDGEGGFDAGWLGLLGLAGLLGLRRRAPAERYSREPGVSRA
jgi:MYXO-CTERM domain-containing protein